MKILILSNVYPPLFIGGYELACHEVAERLQAAGHEVAVLTSTYGLPGGKALGLGPWALGSDPSDPSHAPKAQHPTPKAQHPRPNTQGPRPKAQGPTPPDRVHRTLYYHTVPHFRLRSMGQRAVVEYRDVREVREVLAAERPELIYVWNMGGLTRSLLGIVHDYPAPVVYEIFDGWLAQPPDVFEWAAFWQRPSLHPIKRYMKGPARLVAGRLMPIDLPVLDLRHIVFKSQWLKQAALAFGMPVADAPVIYHGVNRAVFRPTSDERRTTNDQRRTTNGEEVPGGPSSLVVGRPSSVVRRSSEPGLRVLYVGQLAAHKGVHNLVDAFARMAWDPSRGHISLTIAGGSIHPEYVAEVHAAAQFHRLGERVRFVEMVPRYDLPGVYRDHDVLVFPSTWQEPFGLSQVEAMACGIPVIGTGTGGSAEILTPETALRYPPGDTAALAERLALLAVDPDLRRRMGAAALERVARHFDLDQTVRQTEEYLRAVVASWTPVPGAQWKMPFAADNRSGIE